MILTDFDELRVSERGEAANRALRSLTFVSFENWVGRFDLDRSRFLGSFCTGAGIVEKMRRRGWIIKLRAS